MTASRPAFAAWVACLTLRSRSDWWSEVIAALAVTVARPATMNITDTVTGSAMPRSSARRCAATHSGVGVATSSSDG